MAEAEKAPRKPQPPVEELTDEMSAGDIVNALQYLRFVGGQGLVCLDRGVRDYLVRALRRR